jgi:hypothetical protein
MNQTSICPTEAAGIEVELSELRLEVDVKPLATGGSGVDDCVPYEFAADAAALMTAACLRVDQECVIFSVPCDVDESEEDSILVARTDPTETLGPDPVPPPDAWVATMRNDEIDHLVVGHWVPPGIQDHVRHTSSLRERRPSPNSVRSSSSIWLLMIDRTIATAQDRLQVESPARRSPGAQQRAGHSLEVAA